MTREHPDYTYLSTVGLPNDDPDVALFYATHLWRHKPCGGVVADIQAHDGWCGDEHLVRRLARRRKVRGEEDVEQRIRRWVLELLHQRERSDR